MPTRSCPEPEPTLREIQCTKKPLLFGLRLISGFKTAYGNSAVHTLQKPRYSGLHLRKPT
jgi:hypothetical protein